MNQSPVHIEQKYRKMALKSLTNLYIIRFGEQSLSEDTKVFSKEELIGKYKSNIQFWEGSTPEVKQNMSQFELAKHAICSNAVQQLKEKLKSYGIEEIS